MSLHLVRLLTIVARGSLFLARSRRPDDRPPAEGDLRDVGLWINRANRGSGCHVPQGHTAAAILPESRFPEDDVTPRINPPLGSHGQGCAV